MKENTKPMTVTAHTGCEGTADNSLEAIKKGYASGADIVEFDLRFTESGEPVLSHDADGKNCVTLKEAFDLVAKCKDLKVNVDCKTVANIAIVPKLAQECGIADRFFYTGIEAEKVAAVKKNSPGVEYYLNTKVKKWRKNSEKYIRSLVKLIKDNGAVGINIRFTTGILGDLLWIGVFQPLQGHLMHLMKRLMRITLHRDPLLFR